MAIACPKCNSDNPDSKQFCSDCGTQLSPSEEVPIEHSETLQAPRAELTAGSTFADRYQIIEELGKGGMGEVYVAEDRKLNRKVAIKVLPSEMAVHPDRRRRFEREAKAIASLSHPNILSIHDFGEDRGVAFAVMELLEGENLRILLEKAPLSPSTAIDYAKQITDGMAAAHEKGIIHRDLKPENIFISKEGRVKILDFGLAKQEVIKKVGGIEELTKTMTTEPGMIMGTVGYMSPEQVHGQETDHTSDIFSFGAVLYEMLSGQRAFTGVSPADTMSAILKEDPPEFSKLDLNILPPLEKIVRRCLKKRPGERFQSARDIFFALDSLSDADIEALRQFPGDDPQIEAIETAHKSDIVERRQSSIMKRFLSSPVRLVVLSAAILALTLVTIWIMRPTPLLGFSERDWVLVADFQHSQDDDLERALSLALRVGLQESPFVNVVNRSRIESTLELMQKPKDSPIDESIGREICQRAEVKGLLVPALSEVGNEFLMTLKVIEPVSGDTVASYAERTSKDGKLLDSLDSLIQRLRNELGESLKDLQSERKPLAAVTTGHLEALKRFSEGQRAWGLGKYDEAVQHYTEAVKIDKDFAMAYAALGNAYSSFIYNELEKATQNYEKALSQLDRVGSYEEYLIQALYHGSLGRQEDAIRYYNLHLDRYPDDLSSQYNLGNMYRDNGETSKAIAKYNEVLRINPYAANALINLATCLSSEHKADESIQYYKQAFEIRPEWEIQGNINHEYGMTLVEAGRIAEARAVFEKRLAQQKPGERGSAQRSLGQLALFQGNINTAADHFEQAALLHESANIPISAARDRLWWAIGETARRNNKQAGSLLKKAESQLPLQAGWIWLRSHIGSAYIEAGLIDQAKNISKEINTWIEKSDIKNVDSLHRHTILQAGIETNMGNYERALEILRPIQAAQPKNNPFLNAQLAVIYLNMKRWDEGEEMLKAVIDVKWISYEGLIPWIIAHYQLGEIYERIDENTKAIEYYEKFLDFWKDADPGIAEVDDAKKRLAGLKTQ